MFEITYMFFYEKNNTVKLSYKEFDYNDREYSMPDEKLLINPDEF
jgi:hypothetical protein